MTYDALNRLTAKNYPAGSGMTNISYTYDNATGGNYGKGKRTGITDASGVSGYTYDNLGNITSKNGVNYTYGTKPHAVTNVGLKSYTYDANGNMLSGDNRTITWDVENRPVSITKAGVTTTFAYDGDGNRVKQTVGGVTTTYVNKYYEKTGTEVTTNYYLGGKLIAVKKGADLSYILQDHLSSTAGTTSSSGTLTNTITYFSFGAVSSTGASPTDKKFTGQILDTTGLYYYGARYYDPGIGRFISPDTIIPNAASPQFLNKYSYCLNNPLSDNDPNGHFPWRLFIKQAVKIIKIILNAANIVSTYNDYYRAMMDPTEQNMLYFTFDLIDPNPYYNFSTPQKAKIALYSEEWTSDVVKQELSHFEVAGKYGIRLACEFNAIKKADNLIGKGYDVHHLIPQRFAELFKVSPDQMPGILLNQRELGEHNPFTQKWRELLPYDQQYTIEQVRDAVNNVYDGYPEMEKACLEWIDKIQSAGAIIT
jgi:RHS repeat-associated protein